MGVKETRNHEGNTISLQLQVSVLSCTHYYFAYSMLSVTDELCVQAGFTFFC
jgi:hypothetical protein